MSITESEPPGMPGARVGEHPDDLHATLAGDRLELRRSGFAISRSPSMKPAISSTRTPRDRDLGRVHDLVGRPHDRALARPW